LFSGDVVFGTLGYLAEDRTLPVTVAITCEDEAFAGTLRIALPGEDGKGVSYQAAVNCQKGVTENITMEVPQMGNASYFYFQILDSFGTVKFSENVIKEEEMAREADVDSDVSRIYIGVLSNQYENLNYLQSLQMEVDGEMFLLEIVQLSAEDFPADVRELGSLTGILIDSFDTSDLTQSQMNCLISWVEEGGNLLLGTGENAGEVLMGIQDYLGVYPGEVEEEQFNFTDELSYAGSVRLQSSRLSFSTEKEWECFSFSSPGSIYYETFEEGVVMVASFSLMDETFLQWTGRDKVIELLFYENMEDMQDDSQQDDISLWYIKKALYAFMNEAHPKTFYYGLFIIIYLCALIIFAYFLLRRIKRREYIWAVVPIIAIAFTLVLVIREGFQGGESEKDYSALRIYDTSTGQDEYYLLYQNNEGEENTVDLVSAIDTVEPLDYEYRTDKLDRSSISGVSQSYTINYAKNGFDIAFETAVPGTSYILKCSSQSQDMNDTDCFQVDIATEYSYFEGLVTNTSSWDFEKVVLIRGGQYTIVQGLEAGKTVSVQGDDVEFLTNYEEENGMFDDGDETTVLGNLMEYLEQRYILENEDMDTLWVIGVTEEDDFSLFTGETELENHVSVIVNSFAVSSDDNIEYIMNINTSCLNQESQDASLEYDILDKNETEAIYSFDVSGTVWGIFHNRDGFEGTIYAYNYHTREKEAILSQEDDMMDYENLEPYISDNGEMRLTFCLPEGTDYGGAPILSLMVKNTDS
ncbi:MAG: hypothetical protein LUF92_11005, partial [Clostridiales bacterium]|nr:hypothetical protein [Clostridiales bacterium]